MKRKSLKSKSENTIIFHDEDLAQFGDLYFPENKDQIETPKTTLPKKVLIEWENGDSQPAWPISEIEDVYFFDIKKSGCSWASKKICKILEE